jgi:uncharacterized membrane protein YdjX (TVP38/TMEM64 family)
MAHDDLQHLLRERDRDGLVVLPKKVAGLSIASMSCFCLGIGFSLGSYVSGSPHVLWGAGIGGAIALILGRSIQRIEIKALLKHQKPPSQGR